MKLGFSEPGDILKKTPFQTKTKQAGMTEGKKERLIGERSDVSKFPGEKKAFFIAWDRVVWQE